MFAMCLCLTPIWYWHMWLHSITSTFSIITVVHMLVPVWCRVAVLYTYNDMAKYIILVLKEISQPEKENEACRPKLIKINSENDIKNSQSWEPTRSEVTLILKNWIVTPKGLIFKQNINRIPSFLSIIPFSKRKQNFHAFCTKLTKHMANHDPLKSSQLMQPLFWLWYSYKIPTIPLDL